MPLVSGQGSFVAEPQYAGYMGGFGGGASANGSFVAEPTYASHSHSSSGHPCSSPYAAVHLSALACTDPRNSMQSAAHKGHLQGSAYIHNQGYGGYGGYGGFGGYGSASTSMPEPSMHQHHDHMGGHMGHTPMTGSFAFEPAAPYAVNAAYAHASASTERPSAPTPPPPQFQMSMRGSFTCDVPAHFSQCYGDPKFQFQNFQNVSHGPMQTHNRDPQVSNPSSGPMCPATPEDGKLKALNSRRSRTDGGNGTPLRDASNDRRVEESSVAKEGKGSGIMAASLKLPPPPKGKKLLGLLRRKRKDSGCC